MEKKDITIEDVEKLYDAFANWYHDDGEHDNFLRSEAMKTFNNFAASLNRQGWTRVEELEKHIERLMGVLENHFKSEYDGLQINPEDVEHGWQEFKTKNKI